MPSITYGGVKYKQVRHAISCKKCNEVIESKSYFDFKFCSCGTIGIDGGIEDGNRILGNHKDIEIRCVYCYVDKGRKIWLPPDAVEQHFAELFNTPRK